MFLFGLGIGIYWGEGTKVDSISSLRVANSDPGILRSFTGFVHYKPIMLNYDAGF